MRHTKEAQASESNDDYRAEANPFPSRRDFLKKAAATGAVIGMSGPASAGSRTESGAENGFLPAGITGWGAPVRLGNGEVQTFTTFTSAGINHGLYMERIALEGLPSASELEAAAESQYPDKYGVTGEAIEIHHNWSLEFFMPFPTMAATPFTFLGLNWNPAGHPPVWEDPHFDIHFHMLPMATVDAITGPAAPTYDLPAKYIPAGFARGPVVDERVITDMGEHMVDPTVPEMNGGEFTNTLIWGAYDPDGDGVAELTFVEPMITREYLQAHSGVNHRSVAQPEVYADFGFYPTAYAVRDVPNENAVAVIIEQFEFFEGDIWDYLD